MRPSSLPAGPSRPWVSTEQRGGVWAACTSPVYEALCEVLTSTLWSSSHSTDGDTEAPGGLFIEMHPFPGVVPALSHTKERHSLMV